MTENSRNPDEEPTGSTAPGSSEAGSSDATTAPQVDADSSVPPHATAESASPEMDPAARAAEAAPAAAAAPSEPVAAPTPAPAQPAFGYGAEQSGDHSAYAAPAAFGAPAAPTAAAQPAPAAHAAPTFGAPAEASASVPGASFGPAAAAPDYAYATAQPGVTGSGAPAPKTRKRSAAVPIIAALAIGAVLGGASGAGVTAATMSSLVGTSSADSARPATVTVNDSKSVNQTTAVAAKATPSVVTISASSTSAAGTGSGVILDDKGYILTNTHVVTLDGASGDATIEVTLSDGRIFSGKVVGTDPTVDLAVVKIDADDLTPITFGDSDKLNVGDAAIAIGAPLGLSNTVTDGIVSALDRSIQIASSAAPDTGDQNQGGNSGSDDGSPFDFWNNQQGGGSSSGTTSSISIPVIQTDASINPGNSGGALVDDEGKLIGINVAIASAGGSSSSSSQSGSIGVGFSIPANLAKRVADEIIANGTATHGLLGASVSDATLKTSSTVGAVIAETPVSGGAAEKAGLQKGDVVTEFDGHPITSATDLTAQVRAEAGGSTAKLTYVRDGRATTVEVTLGTYSS